MRAKIVKEIRRIGERTGVVPGAGTFFRETGIPEKEWKGVFWARWGDALVEAGFRANELQKKYDHKDLLQQYCEATRSLEKSPTRLELRMYSKSVGNFPSYSTFLNHFGSVENLRASAREWAEKNPEFSDVVERLPQKTEVCDPPKHKPLHEGWVYLLKSGSHYKIGRGEDLERRVKQVSVALPETVKLVHSIRTDDPSVIESYWHRRFSDKRANGEWFSLSGQDVNAFKKRKYQ
jgi:Meiotically up-regulated gene 113